MLIPFSNMELAPILEAYQRMLNEGYLTDTVNKNASPELEDAMVKALEKQGFEVRRGHDGYSLMLDGRLFAVCSTLGDIFGVFNTFVNIGQKYYSMLKKGQNVDDISVWNDYLNRFSMMHLADGRDGGLELYGTGGNLLRTFDGMDGFMEFVRKCQQMSQKLALVSKRNISGYGSDRGDYMERQKEWTRQHGFKSRERINRYQRERMKNNPELYRKQLAYAERKRDEMASERISSIADPLEKFINAVKHDNVVLWRSTADDDETRKLVHRIFGKVTKRCRNAGLPDSTAKAMTAMCTNRFLKGLPPDDVYDAFVSNGFSLPHAIAAFTGKSVGEVERELGGGTDAKPDALTVERKVVSPSPSRRTPRRTYITKRRMDDIGRMELPQMPMSEMRGLCGRFFRRGEYDTSAFNPYGELYRIQQSNPRRYAEFLRFLDENGYMG